MCSNLDETTRTVHKENVALAERLSEFMKEEEVLKGLNNRLRDENSLLTAEAENSEALLKEKTSDSRKKANKISEVNNGSIKLIHHSCKVVSVAGPKNQCLV